MSTRTTTDVCDPCSGIVVCCVFGALADRPGAQALAGSLDRLRAKLAKAAPLDSPVDRPVTAAQDVAAAARVAVGRRAARRLPSTTTRDSAKSSTARIRAAGMVIPTFWRVENGIIVAETTAEKPRLRRTHF